MKLFKISMAGCLQVLILTFVVYLRSRGNNFTLIFELINNLNMSDIVQTLYMLLSGFSCPQAGYKGDQLLHKLIIHNIFFFELFLIE